MAKLDEAANFLDTIASNCNDEKRLKDKNQFVIRSSKKARVLIENFERNIFVILSKRVSLINRVTKLSGKTWVFKTNIAKTLRIASSERK